MRVFFFSLFSCTFCLFSIEAAHLGLNGVVLFQRKSGAGPKNHRADHVFDLLFPDIKDMRFSSGLDSMLRGLAMRISLARVWIAGFGVFRLGYGLQASGFSDAGFARQGLDCRVWVF